MKTLTKLMFLTSVLTLLVCQPNVSAATYTLFTTQEPDTNGPPDGHCWQDYPNGVLGTRFSTDTAGWITGLRYYAQANDNDVTTLKLWDYASRTELASVSGTPSGAVGWFELSLPTPVAVTAGTEYVVSYNAGANGYYVGVHDFFAGPLVNGPLTAPAGAGIFGDSGFPNMGPYQNASYFADIVFTDDIGAAAIRLQGNGLDIADGDTTPRTADGTDFGDVELEAGLVERTFTLSNPCQLDLELTGTPMVAITGPQAADFTVTLEPDTTVVMGGSTTFTLQFNPSAEGVRSATVSIANSANPTNDFDFAIRGRSFVAAPILGVQGNGLDILDGDTTPRSADGTHFGSMEPGMGAVEHTFTITNAGQLDLEITGNPTVVIAGPQAGDFTVTAEPDALVPAGGTTTFAIQFHPSAPGLRTATVVITNNATPANAFYFAIAGTGTDPNRQTLFSDAKTGSDSGPEGNPYELGTVFRASVAGKVTHVRVYALATESGDHTVRLWRNADDALLAGPLTWNYGGTEGWITLDILDVPIEPDVDYTVSVSTGSEAGKHYPIIADDPDMISGGGNGMHLTYPANAGTFEDVTMGLRPAKSWHSSCYLRDVVFQAGLEGGDNYYSFEDVVSDLDAVDGIHNGIDFGLGQWLGRATWAGLTQCGFFSDYVTSRSFSLPAGKTLKAIRLASSGTGTWRVSDGVNPEHSGTFQADTPVQVLTDWRFAGTNITVELSDIEYSAIDDIGYGDPSQDAPPPRLVAISVDPASGDVVLRWEGLGAQFQVEKATVLGGPFQPLGAAQSARSYTDAGTLNTNTSGFYRVRRL